MDVPKPVHTSVAARSQWPTIVNQGVLVNTLADAWCKSLHHETSVCGRGEAWFYCEYMERGSHGYTSFWLQQGIDAKTNNHTRGYNTGPGWERESVCSFSYWATCIVPVHFLLSELYKYIYQQSVSASASAPAGASASASVSVSASAFSISNQLLYFGQTDGIVSYHTILNSRDENYDSSYQSMCGGTIQEKSI